jgi:hypothetical protein
MLRRILAPSIHPFLIPLFALLCSACSVTQEIYLQEVRVRAPLFQPPVFVTDSTEARQFRIAPSISFGNAHTFMGSVEGHTRVNRDGRYQLDTTRNGYEISFEGNSEPHRRIAGEPCTLPGILTDVRRTVQRLG